MKTTCNNNLIVSNLSTLLSATCPPKIRIYTPKMWTKYWQSRGQLIDYQICVQSFINDLRKWLKNTIKIGIWMDPCKKLWSDGLNSHPSRDFLRKKSSAGARWTSYWQSLFFLLQLWFFGWFISFSFLFELFFLFFLFCLPSNVLFFSWSTSFLL